MYRRDKVFRRLVAVSAVAVLAIPGVAQAKAAKGKPINIGNVSTLTGPVQFPEASQGAAAAFKAINAAGGIKGRPIKFIVKDDAYSPATAASVGQSLVDQDHVVANVASFSAGGDCSANASLYKKDDLANFGFLLSPACATLKTWGSINTGPIVETALSFVWLTKKWPNTVDCFNGIAAPGNGPEYEAALAAAKKDDPKVNFKIFQYTQGNTASPTPFIVQLKNAGCQVVFFAGALSNNVSQVQALQTQGWKPTAVVLGSPTYDADYITGAGAAANGTYSMSDFLPYTSSNKYAVAYRKAVAALHYPASSFSEGGYIAAQDTAAVLKSIKGAITPKSVTAAFEKFHITNPLNLGPAKFNPSGYLSAQVLQVRNGKFVSVGAPLTLPAKDLAP